MDLNETYAKIEGLLELEEKPHALESITARQARREQVSQAIGVLSAEISKINSRFRHLLDLPPMYLVDWAKAVLELPNLSFVVLETTSVDDDADILRVLVTNREGNALCDCIVHPQRYFSTNSAYTGLTVDQIVDAHPLDEYWTHIRSVLAGRYVLAYNLNFVRNRLDENASHYGLPTVTLIGEDLQDKARSYWSSYYRPKLLDLCHRIGHQLPQPATAPDRVVGQLAILKAMSQGITNVAVPVGVGVEEEDFEPEDNPF